MRGQCDCGNVTVTIPELPPEMNACPCEFCSRVGARWGYFKRDTVQVDGKTDVYRRATRTIEFHRCSICGVVTHWHEPKGRLPHMGVQMLNFDRVVIAEIPIVIEP